MSVLIKVLMCGVCLCPCLKVLIRAPLLETVRQWPIEVDDATKKGRLLPYENRSYDALNTLIGGRLGKKRPDYCLTIIVLRCTEHL